MIFGRSTVVIMGAIIATAQFVKAAIKALFPGVDPTVVDTLVDGATTVIGAWVAVLAYTSTTPVNDARIPAGTKISVTNAAGDVVGTTNVKATAKTSDDGMA